MWSRGTAQERKYRRHAHQKPRSRPARRANASRLLHQPAVWLDLTDTDVCEMLARSGISLFSKELGIYSSFKMVCYDYIEEPARRNRG